MVDFNNDSTVGVPATDVQRISILQRRYELIESLEDYKKKKFANTNCGMGLLRARLISLFVELQATLKRRWNNKNDKDKYDKIKKACFESTEEEKIIESIFIINEELDEMRLTRIDTQKKYDGGDVEAENKEKGF
ncbi:unnamed protein product [marine sediment metagenome]|uniref:Uncharacterized protein n=1 Tax=marine sediment metagenome TaxID=412755 RepID=X1V6I5_9ZZZZ